MMGVGTGAGVAREQLEAWVPAGHLLRRVDRVLDLAGVRDALARGGTPEFTRAAWARKKVEARFAELKRFVRLRRLRLRGLPRAAEQFLLAAAAQNLKRLAAAPAPP